MKESPYHKLMDLSQLMEYLNDKMENEPNDINAAELKRLFPQVLTMK